MNAKEKTETPPQAWGRRLSRLQGDKVERNTPTGVGKTAPQNAPLLMLKKHPHRRGEDQRTTWQTAREQETPPQAWGRRRC